MTAGAPLTALLLPLQGSGERSIREPPPDDADSSINDTISLPSQSGRAGGPAGHVRASAAELGRGRPSAVKCVLSPIAPPDRGCLDGGSSLGRSASNRIGSSAGSGL